MSYTWEDFDSVFGTSVSNSLGTTIDGSHVRSTQATERATERGMLEITINYPRDKKYLSMDNDHRRTMYEMLFTGLKDYLIKKYGFVRECKYVFENSNIGLHLHGYIHVDLDGLKGSVYGLVEESSRYLLKSIPPGKSRINTYERGTFFSSFPRFVCPAVCIQYNCRPQEWETYIGKAQ